jgi:ATP-dependent protease ClpP protease subunit
MTEKMSEHNDYLSSISEFNSKGKVLITGSFSNSLMADFAGHQFIEANEAAVNLGLSYTTILIDSEGGSIATLQKIVSCMDMFRPNSDHKYIGYTTVQAVSAAFDLLQYCDWRVCYPGTSLLLHYGSMNITNYEQAMLYENPRKAMKYQLARLDDTLKLYARRSKLNKTQLHDLCKSDARITGRQALEFGFIDELIEVAPESIPERPNYSL